MSRSAVVFSLSLSLSLALASACTVNGKSVGPHFGGGDSSAPPATSSSEAASTSASSEPDTIVTVPDVAGLDEAAARAKLAALGFSRIEISSRGEYCDGQAPPRRA